MDRGVNEKRGNNTVVGTSWWRGRGRGRGRTGMSWGMMGIGGIEKKQKEKRKKYLMYFSSKHSRLVGARHNKELDETRNHQPLDRCYVFYTSVKENRSFCSIYFFFFFFFF